MNRQTIFPAFTCLFVLGTAMTASADRQDQREPSAFYDAVWTQPVFEDHSDSFFDSFRPNRETAPARLHTDVPDLPRSGIGGIDPNWFISPNRPTEKFHFDSAKYKWALRPFGSHDRFGHRHHPRGSSENAVFGGEPEWLSPKLYQGGDTGFVDRVLPRFGDELIVLSDARVHDDFNSTSGTALAIPAPATSAAVLLGLGAAYRRRRRS